MIEAVLLSLAMTVTALSAQPHSEAPALSFNGKYCLRVEAGTGSKVETVECMTREQWAAQGVDLDKEWAEEGVVLKG
jgi:hypothetical protein